MNQPTIRISFNRQKHLLELLKSFGGSKRNLDFQKLLFLYCQETTNKKLYDFIPYRFGAFSFTSYADRRKLADQGLLEKDVDRWILTNIGLEALACSPLDNISIKEIEHFALTNKNIHGNELVAKTYRSYPYYGVHSKIANKVLQNDPGSIKAIEHARPKLRNKGLVTIGYEGRTLEAYLNILIQDGVSLLCDVRRNALSRKYGFSKKTLSHACEGVGIRYVHLPELGILSTQRKDLTDQASYDRLFSRYDREILPNSASSLNRIQSWVQNGERVALTCFEHKPDQCHRHRAALALEKKYGHLLSPCHL